jgi:hypothetical protein
MRLKVPKNNERFHWTNHVIEKMLFYGLSEQRIKRVINRPDRVEEGVAPKTIACMQVAGSKKHRQEIWTMYQKRGFTFLRKSASSQCKSALVKIISAWRYPGKSPAKNPIPAVILEEVKNLL